MCFTFDGRTPDQSSLCIEGTFNLSDRSLRNVTYRGIRATTGTTVAGQQQGIFVTYTFTGLQRLDGSGLIPTSYIRQYNRSAASSTWQVNSEFTPANNTQTTITHAGTVILLVLDCSSSLGSQFSDMQSYARDFISRVAQNAVDIPTLAAPQNVTASLAEDGKVILVQWDAVKFAESYDVYRSSSASGTFTKVAEEVTATTWLDENPLEGTNYYRVVAKGYGMTSAQSRQSNGLSPDADPPQFDRTTKDIATDVNRTGSIPESGVDMGVSVKWASWNLGAIKNGNQIGRYYAWGETETKETFSNDTYTSVYKEVTTDDIENKTIAEEYDAAHALWGGTWRMPTVDEVYDLIAACTIKKDFRNGYYGLLLTSKTTGNTIFLPFSGYYNENNQISSEMGFCWTSTPFTLSAEFRRKNSAQAFRFEDPANGSDEPMRIQYLNRYYGLPIRPVQP